MSVVLLFSLGVFQHTHYLPVFILILLYSLSVILIGFMITPFFDNSRVSGITFYRFLVFAFKSNTNSLGFSEAPEIDLERKTSTAGTT